MAYVPRFIRRTVLATLCCGLFLMLAAPAALAHDSLKSSSPAKDAKVSTVEQIKLEFSAHVLFPVIVLREANGKAVTIGKAHADGPKVTSEVPETLSAGGYVIAWRVVSSDGHPIEGEIPFTVTGRAGSSATPTTNPTPTSALTPPAAALTPAQPISPSPVSATNDQESAQGLSSWIWVALAVLLMIGAGVWLRTSRQDPPDSAE
jgi:copper resistance protein C